MKNYIENRAYEGLDCSAKRREGDVAIRFHTYTGFLLIAEQLEHRVFLPPGQAMLLLKRLHRHNLIWGLICPGALIIPFASFLAHAAQVKSIKRQALEGWVPDWVNSENQESTYASFLSKFFVILGYVLFIFPIVGLLFSGLACLSIKGRQSRWRKAAVLAFKVSLGLNLVIAVLLILGKVFAA